MQQTILHFIQTNATVTKYSLVVIVLFVMLLSVKTYVNYVTIQTEIEKVKIETIQREQQKLYEEKFVIPYEQSEYAMFFLKHEHNILSPNEFVIRFEKKNIQQSTENNTNKIIRTPEESWKHFLQTIKEKYKK